MSTIYIHIGTPKTGTTFLQKFLGKNKKRLEKQGVAFPLFEHTYDKVDPYRNAFFLKCTTESGNAQQDKELANYIYQKNMRELASLKGSFDKIILTDESLWNSRKPDWEKIAYDFLQMEVDVKIVAYLRRQDSFVQSLWAQKVKSGYSKSFSTFLKSNFMYNYHLNYYERLRDFAALFGEDNIIARTYDTKRLERENKTLASDFLEAIDVEYTSNLVEPTNDRMNPSLSGIYLETKRLLNRYPAFCSHQNWGTKLLTSIMSENNDFVNFNSNQFFDYRACKKFLKKYNYSNHLVATEFMNKKDGQLFESLPEKKAFQANAKYDLEDFVHVLAQMLIKQESLHK